MLVEPPQECAHCEEPKAPAVAVLLYAEEAHPLCHVCLVEFALTINTQIWVELMDVPSTRVARTGWVRTHK